MAAQFFINGAVFASFLPRLPEIRDQVGISVDQVGLLLSIAGFAGLAGSAMVGPAIARFGTRPVILAAGTVVSLALPVVGLARSSAVLLAGLIAILTFDVLVDVGMNMQGSWLSARRHTPVMSRLHGLWSLGTVVGGLSSARIAATGVSLSTHLSIVGLALLAALFVVGRGLLRVDESAESSLTPASTGQDAPAAGRWLLPVLAVIGFLALAVESTSIEWAAFRFVDDYGAAASFAALGYVAVTVGMTIGRFGGDWAAVRLGPARHTQVATALSAAGLSVATLVDDQQLNLVGYLIAGIGIASMLPNIYDRAAKHPGRPGAGLGALTAGLRTAALTIPFAVGSLAAGRSVGVSIAIITLPSLVGFAILSRVLQTPPSPRPQPRR